MMPRSEVGLAGLAVLSLARGVLAELTEDRSRIIVLLPFVKGKHLRESSRSELLKPHLIAPSRKQFVKLNFCYFILLSHFIVQH